MLVPSRCRCLSKDQLGADLCIPLTGSERPTYLLDRSRGVVVKTIWLTNVWDI